MTIYDNNYYFEGGKTMNELQKINILEIKYCQYLKLNQELTYKDKKFNKRSDYDNIIKYIDNFLEGKI